MGGKRRGKQKKNKSMNNIKIIKLIPPPPPHPPRLGVGGKSRKTSTRETREPLIDLSFKARIITKNWGSLPLWTKNKKLTTEGTYARSPLLHLPMPGGS